MLFFSRDGGVHQAAQTAIPNGSGANHAWTDRRLLTHAIANSSIATSATRLSFLHPPSSSSAAQNSVQSCLLVVAVVLEVCCTVVRPLAAESPPFRIRGSGRHRNPNALCRTTPPCLPSQPPTLSRTGRTPEPHSRCIASFATIRIVFIRIACSLSSIRKAHYCVTCFPSGVAGAQA